MFGDVVTPLHYQFWPTALGQLDGAIQLSLLATRTAVSGQGIPGQGGASTAALSYVTLGHLFWIVGVSPVLHLFGVIMGSLWAL